MCQEMFEDIHQVVSEVYVRIKDLPISDSIRDLRCAPSPLPFMPSILHAGGRLSG